MKKLNLLVTLSLLAVPSLLMTSCDEGEFKVGLICLHDESSSYDANFIDAMYRALDNLGLERDQLELVTGINEDNSCYEAATDLASSCEVIFADSFGHEKYLMKAAQENEEVYFCHATGTKAHTAGLDNFFNAFASIYEGRYLAGVAAGMKINEMITNGDITSEQAKVGYVGAFPYAEVVSGYTAFFLGVRSEVPTATMSVRYTSTWYDYDKEKSAAEALIDTDKCVLISQHADSYGAPQACEEKGVPNVAYNGATSAQCPNTYVISSKIDWTPYYELMIKAKMDDKEIEEKDFTGTLATGSVKLEPVGSCAAQGTEQKLESVKAQLIAGTLHVFDTNSFTVGGQKLSTYLADVDDDGTYVGETEAISEGYFHESEYRSAPYFDLRIDGITEQNN
ncbi:MAG: BMP family ABC transporter substrate-binding protein [Bacilli bacterium]